MIKQLRWIRKQNGQLVLQALTIKEILGKTYEEWVDVEVICEKEENE